MSGPADVIEPFWGFRCLRFRQLAHQLGKIMGVWSNRWIGMKRRGIPITLDLVGLLVVALLVREWFRPAEPVYQGRSVSAWIEALGVQEGSSRQMQAAWSVGGIASLGGLISTPIGVSLAPGSVVTRSSGGGGGHIAHQSRSHAA